MSVDAPDARFVLRLARRKLSVYVAFVVDVRSLFGGVVSRRCLSCMADLYRWLGWGDPVDGALCAVADAHFLRDDVYTCGCDGVTLVAVCLVDASLTSCV